MRSRTQVYSLHRVVALLVALVTVVAGNCVAIAGSVLTAAPAAAAGGGTPPPAFNAVCPVAGAGHLPGLAGDGGPATSALLNSPQGLAFDGSGNLYVSDTGNNVIRKIDTAGNITTFASLPNPWTLSFDPTRNVIYVAQPAGNIVSQVAVPSGAVTKVAGTGTSGWSGDGGAATAAMLAAPQSVSVQGNNLYVADTQNNRIRVIDLTTGVITNFAGTGATAPAGTVDIGTATNIRINHPEAVSTDSGHVYEGDRDYVVRIVATAPSDPSLGQARVMAGTGVQGDLAGITPSNRVASPVALADDAAHSRGVFVADYLAARVKSILIFGLSSSLGPIAGTGQVGLAGSGGVAISAQLGGPSALAIAPNGDLYVADAINNRIWRMPLGTAPVQGNATISVVAGSGPAAGQIDGTQGGAFNTDLIAPAGLALEEDSSAAQFATKVKPTTPAQGDDSVKSVYYGDAVGNRVVGFDRKGQMSLVAGSGARDFLDGSANGDGASASAAKLAGVKRIAVSQPAGATNVYILEQSARIRLASPGGNIAAYAGTGSTTASGDGGSATSAGLGNVADIASDNSTGLFLAVANPPEVRAIAPVQGFGNVIVRYAGTGTPGFSGDGGPAVNARFQHPAAIAVDRQSKAVYVWDGARIRAIDFATDTISTYAGTGTAGNDTGPVAAASANIPDASSAPGASMTIDNDGNLYFGIGSTVWRVDAATHTLITVASDGAQSAGAQEQQRSTTDAHIGAIGGLAARDALYFLDSAPAASSSTGYPSGAGSGNQRIGALLKNNCADAVAFEQPAPVSEGPAWYGYRAPGQSVPVTALPSDDLPLPSSANAPDVGATALESAGTADAGVVSSALQTIPLRFIPLRFIPLRFIGMFTLANVPTTDPGGWAALLVNTPFAGRPLLQDVNLADVLDPASYGGTLPSNLASLTLRDIDLQNSPLRFISIASFVLGPTPLRFIPLNDSLAAPAATDADRFKAWCTLLAAPPINSSCAALQLTPDSPFLAIDLAGVPLRFIPLRFIPLRFINLTQSGLQDLPLRFIDLSVSPLRFIPLRFIDLSVSPLRFIPLRFIDLSTSPLRFIPLDSLGANLSQVVDCGALGGSCLGKTLGDAAAANAILANATLSLLAVGTVLDPYQLGDLGYYKTLTGDDITLGQIAGELPASPEITLADVLIGLVPRSALPWEGANVSLENLPIALLAAGGSGGIVNFFVDLQVYPASYSPPNTTPTITVTMPDGFSYETGNAAVTDGGPTTGVEPTVNGSQLTFTLPPNSPPGLATLSYHLVPGIDGGDPGPGSVSISQLVSNEPDTTVPVARYKDGMGTCNGECSTAYTANGDGTEPFNNTPANAPMIAPNALTAGLFGGGVTQNTQDLDFYQLPVPAPGTTTEITLSHLAVDGDLVVYPPGWESASGATPPLRPSSPFRQIGSAPVLQETTDPELNTSNQTANVQTASDLPHPIAAAPAAVSDNRGTADESVDLYSDGTGYDPTCVASTGSCTPGHTYLVQLSNYNNATSNTAYLLYARQTAAAGGSTCSARNFLHAGDSGPNGNPTGSTPFSVPTGTQTMYLVSQKRLADEYGLPAEAQVMTKLTSLAAATHGFIVQIDDINLQLFFSIQTRSALQLWDAAPCSVAAANAVVSNINRTVDQLLPAGSALRAGVQNIVVVGGDEQIPFARVPDGTRSSNEADYAGDALKFTGGASPESSALGQRMLLSDSPYGSFNPVAWKAGAFYLPDVALGRLVETPGDITKQIDEYTQQNYLDSSTSLVTGYDFLADGAQAVDSALKTNTGIPDAQRQQLINETWTATDLTAKLFPAGGAPRIDSINGHFNHHDALPAAGSANSSATLFHSSNVTGASGASLADSLVFSMGCHSGLSVSDLDYGQSGGTSLDWPQAFASQGAISIGNTGFGYGDSAAVAYSERLMKLFAQHLDHTMTVGQALMRAKQDYYSSLGAFSDYDAKVLEEATFYGLPMFNIGTPAQQTAPADPASTVSTQPTDPVTGIASAAIHVPSTFSPATPTAPLYTANGQDPQVTSNQPIEPRTEVDVTAPTGSTAPIAHGALITGLTSHDGPTVSGSSLAFGQATIDLTAHDPNIQQSGAAFPSVLQNVASYTANGKRRDKLVLISGQWVPDPTNPALGKQRLFDDIATSMYFRPATDLDFTAPTFGSVDAQITGSTLHLTVNASDVDQTNQPGTVKRVTVLYLDQGTWHPLDLTASGSTWSGSVGVSGTNAVVPYFVQAVDASGNVGVSSNKAQFFIPNLAPVVAAPTSPVTAAALSPMTTIGTFSDSQNGPWTGTVDYGRPGDTPQPLELLGSHYVLDATYTTPGTYTATLTICDAKQSCGTLAVPVTVAAPTGPIMSVSDVTVMEGDSGSPKMVFNVTRSDTSGSVTVGYQTVALSAAQAATTKAAGDYVVKSGTLLFKANQGSKTVVVNLKPNTNLDADRAFALELSNVSGGVMGRRDGIGTIRDDDATATTGASVGDVRVVEGNLGKRTIHVPVFLRAAAGSLATVQYHTVPLNASQATKPTAAGDYVSHTGTLKLRAGVTGSISIVLLPDTVADGTKSFQVVITGPAGAIARDTGTVTILDDD